MSSLKHQLSKKTKRNKRILSAVLALLVLDIVAICILAAIPKFKPAHTEIKSDANSVGELATAKTDTASRKESKKLSTAKASAAETEDETEIVASVEEIEPAVAETTYNYSEDAELLAKVIYLESGSCSEYCQWLVGSTIMNQADMNGGLYEVAHNYNIFEVAPYVDECVPSDLSLSVAYRVLSGDRDYDVNAFRESYYHEWATPYTNVDNVYFSIY
jgi:hypothetical protein